MKTYLMIGIVTVLAVAGFFFVQPPLTTEAGATLPPREPTPTPTTVAPDVPNVNTPNDDSGPIGAYLVLQDAQPGAWSAVQWQDSNGDWQIVEGWQGAVNADGSVMWWVAQKDFGSGPFRWVVDEWTSDSFQLPSESGAWQIVR